MGSFTAAGTAYATHGEPMIPFYIFYSMFGYQRVGDLVWAFGDARGRGFLLGATAGRTTLNGEGLQHQDGHSPLLYSAVPNCEVYDAAYAYEVAVIIREGMRRMYERGEDVFYYLTLYNENYPMPAMPEGTEEGILRGLYRLQVAAEERANHVQLFASGTAMPAALEAQRMLLDHDVAADVWSVTSYLALRNDALAVERWNRLHPDEPQRRSYLEEQLSGIDGRAQRHTHGAAQPLRGRCPQHHRRRAGRVGARGAHPPPCCHRRHRAVRDPHGASRAAAAVVDRPSGVEWQRLPRKMAHASAGAERVVEDGVVRHEGRCHRSGRCDQLFPTAAAGCWPGLPGAPEGAVRVVGAFVCRKAGGSQCRDGVLGEAAQSFRIAVHAAPEHRRAVVFREGAEAVETKNERLVRGADGTEGVERTAGVLC